MVKVSFVHYIKILTNSTITHYLPNIDQSSLKISKK